ncbi:hypothetical protein JM83_2684 [Gillisia sp. Hel_I_86]|nr:hypothetical protein JM83_2684 [Gillisia sp. Hel_I_86]
MPREVKIKGDSRAPLYQIEMKRVNRPNGVCAVWLNRGRNRNCREQLTGNN